MTTTPLVGRLDHTRSLDLRARTLAARTHEQKVEAIRAASEAGMTQAAIGEVLGVSRQRVNQLLREARA
jgi:DNA-binding transcriptional regulator LsrR (DeoR family)